MLFCASFLAFSCSDDDNDEPKSNEKQILEFLVGDKEATIDQTAKTITLALPSGSDLTKIKPVIKISEKAAVNPATDTEQNFTNPVKYTVTAEDGTQQEYTAIITVSKSSDKEILSFHIGNTAGTIDRETMFIHVEVAAGTDVTSLKPQVNISQGATVSPASETEQDFTDPVIYTVTAEDGSKQEYTVIVKDEIASADPRVVTTIIMRDDTERPYRRLDYDHNTRLVQYTITAAESPGDEKNMDVIKIEYGNDNKVTKIIRIEDAETVKENIRTLDVSYPDTETIHVTEQATGTAIKSDVITLNDAGRVSKFVKDEITETFEYDKAGNLTKITYPDGKYKVISYDDKNGIFKDGNTPQWIWLYTKGNLISVGPNNYLSEKIYTPDGQLSETIEYKYSYQPFSWYPNAYKKVDNRVWTVMFYSSMKAM